MRCRLARYLRGATTAEKLRGTKVWVPTPGRARPEAGLRMGAGGGRPLPLWGSEGVTPGKFFENSDAKSCILVAPGELYIPANNKHVKG